MSELGTCLKMALNLILGDVINGRRMAGREGGCSGPLEVTGLRVRDGEHSLHLRSVQSW